jgi:amino-acid N-acetyltransferase
VFGDDIHRGPGFAAAVRLLSAASLPVADLTPAHCENFFYLGEKGRPSGVVGLEPHGEVALLRSLAIAADTRRTGGGSRLLAHAEAAAQARGVKNLYLLTTTAETFFGKRGYRLMNREAAPQAIRDTREFSGICPASSAFMVKVLV